MTWRQPSRGDEGFALPSAMMLMVIVLLVTAVGATAVVRSFEEVRQDRSSMNAFEATDAAVDILLWRMNKQLTASEISHLGGLSSGLLTTLGCADVDALDVVQVTVVTGSGTCELEITPDGGPPVTCQSSLGVTLDAGGLVNLSALNGLLVRDVICSATVNNASRRIFSRIVLDLNAGTTLASPTSLWRRAAWQECGPAPSACPPA
jgi:hypothetical protein